MGKRERRHHRRRMIAKALKVYNKERALYNYDHMAQCSCYMCGNQRNNTWQSTDERLTMQERRANDNYKDQLNETIRKGLF